MTSVSRRCVLADVAPGPFGQVEADLAQPDLGLHLADRVRECERVVVGRAKHVEGKALSGPLPDPGQLCHLGDQPLDRLGVQRAPARYIPGRPRPPRPPPPAADPPMIPPMRGRRELLRSADPLVDRRHDHVLEQLGILGVDGLGVDRDLEQAHVAAHLELHHAAARAGIDDLVLQPLLGLVHLGLHLLGLLHHRVQIEPAGPASGSCHVLRRLSGVDSRTRVESGVHP